MLELTLLFDEEKPSHGSDPATSVAWANPFLLLSCGDDHKILKWNVENGETKTLVDLPSEFYPICMEFQKGTGIGNAKKTNELLLVAGSDGSFHLYGKANRLEKTIQAHQGAIISASWSPNGSEILTSGEDGFLRIWSRAGMLRTVLAQHASPIYTCKWSPNGRSVLYAVDRNLIIRPTNTSNISGVSSSSSTIGSASGKGSTVEWKGAEGLILTISWSSTANLIVSGGEDCKYRVWQGSGSLVSISGGDRCIFTSVALEHPILSSAWTPSGEMFAVGTTNMIRLCDRFGWTQAIETPKIGSIYSLEWNIDGTGFGGATSQGITFLANVIAKSYTWKNLEVVLTSSNVITVTEFTTNGKDYLEFQERVVFISINHGYLLVLTPSQIYIYNVSNLPSHILFDLKEANSVYYILQSKRNFVMCSHSGIQSRTYDGRQLAWIKWPGMQTEMLNVRTSSLAEDMISLIDQSDSRRFIRVYDVHNGRSLFEQEWNVELVQIALAQNDLTIGGRNERLLAFLDKNQEVHLSRIRRTPTGKSTDAGSAFKKLGTSVLSICWHSEAPMLATIQNSNKVIIFYHPHVLFVDDTLVEQTIEEKDIGETGPSPELLSYTESYIKIRRADGTLICTSGNFFVPKLYNLVITGNYTKARRLCRYANDGTLWGVLAGLASINGELDTAEVCFSEIGHFDKVEFLTNAKKMSDDLLQKAYYEMFVGGLAKGEEVLLKSGHYSDAIHLNIQCTNYERALELAVKYNEDVNGLLEKRQEFLYGIGIGEEFSPALTITKNKGQGQRSSGSKEHLITTEDDDGEQIH